MSGTLLHSQRSLSMISVSVHCLEGPYLCPPFRVLERVGRPSSGSLYVIIAVDFCSTTRTGC
jgi:hypothetical protein